MAECVINDPPHYQCCCNCRNRVVTVPRGSPTDKPNGFACSAPMTMAGDPFQRMVFVDWPEHSCGCELYDSINGRAGREV